MALLGALLTTPALAQDPQVPAPVAATAQERIAASHILISYEGATRARATVRRSREEARARAEMVRDKVLEGEDFNALAREYSDDPSGPRGGFLGGFTRGAMVQPFEDAAFRLPVGGVSAVVETEYGFHVIRREPLNEAHVAQIMVQWAGIPGSKATRTKAEARALAEDALTRLRSGVPFDEVARTTSDGPTASRGGDLGWFTRGQFLPQFEEAAFSLKPGQTSGLVETAVGYHVIKRLE